MLPVWRGRGRGRASNLVRVSNCPVPSGRDPGEKDRLCWLVVLLTRFDPLLFCRSRDTGDLQEEEEEEEVTGSLLKGPDLPSSLEEEEEEDACPPLLPGPPRPQRLQSTLHCINLRVRQVDQLSELQIHQSMWLPW